MHPRYRGRVGEYLKELDERRFERYKDRPWELQSRSQHGGEFFVMVFVIAAALGLLVLLSLL